MKRYRAYSALLGIGLFRVMVWLLRSLMCCVLLCMRPVVGLVFGAATALCLVGLVLGLLIARDQHHMLWAFFGAGVVSTAIPVFYDAIVLALAPGHFPLLRFR